MILGIVASNMEKMPPVWFARCYGLTSAVYKEILQTKVFPWVKFFHGKVLSYVFQHDGVPVHTEWLCRTGWTPTWAFVPKILAPTITKFEPLGFQFVNAHWGKTDELKASVNCAWRSTRKGFVRKVCKSFQPPLERFIAAKGGYSE